MPHHHAHGIYRAWRGRRWHAVHAGRHPVSHAACLLLNPGPARGGRQVLHRLNSHCRPIKGLARPTRCRSNVKPPHSRPAARAAPPIPMRLHGAMLRAPRLRAASWGAARAAAARPAAVQRCAPRRRPVLSVPSTGDGASAGSQVRRRPLAKHAAGLPHSHSRSPGPAPAPQHAAPSERPPATLPSSGRAPGRSPSRMRNSSSSPARPTAATPAAAAAAAAAPRCS
jgi:hypothetical protein